MSNILIIKHGSLGDIVQISGVLHDIRENNKDKNIFILTTTPYVELLSKCPYLDGVLIDKRLPRWNLFYLIKLKKMLSKYIFTHVYDLQNSSRTLFYKKFLLKNSIWSNTDSSLENGMSKKDFEEESVLKRFEIQLKKSNINTKHTTKPNLSWACINIDNVVNQFFKKKYILIFPFCSPKLSHKKWPHYNNLIKIIREKYPEIEIAIAPMSSEIMEAKKIDSTLISNNNKCLSILELTGLIQKASYVIANDTGPAHMAAHLGKNGIVLFGYHTTPKKVSIETNKFKAITVDDLNLLTAENVFLKIKKQLDLI